MNYILITTDSYTKGGMSKPAIDIALPRLKAGRWPLYKSTHFAKKILPGDNFLAYIGGIYKFKNNFISFFKAENVISKNLNDVDNNLLDLTNKYPSREIIFSPIDLKEIKSVNIKDYLDILDHTKNRKSKTFWGACMMGGVINISDYDFKLIFSKLK